MKIAIADDHKLFRKGLISILTESNEISGILEAENGKELLDKLVSSPVDIILLDLNMPEMNGWDVLTELRKEKNSARVLILSMYEEESFIIQSIEKGACGFLSKNAEPDEILLAMQSVHQTGYYFNDKTTRAVMKKMVSKEDFNPEFPDAPIELSERETQVLKVICQELNSQEISEKLFMSLRLVQEIRTKLYHKFGAKNSVGLVLNAAKKGYVQL
jgi:DNA-binding NarL/FixJ family response regulator